jgi:hypothetical protein
VPDVDQLVDVFLEKEPEVSCEVLYVVVVFAGKVQTVLVNLLVKTSVVEDVLVFQVVVYAVGKLVSTLVICPPCTNSFLVQLIRDCPYA